MKMIAAVGIHGGVKKFRMSMQDLTNEKQMQSISKIKKSKQEFEKMAMGIAKDTGAKPQGGLMAAPVKEEE